MGRSWIIWEEDISIEELSDTYCYGNDTGTPYIIKITTDFEEVLKDSKIKILRPGYYVKRLD